MKPLVALLLGSLLVLGACRSGGTHSVYSGHRPGLQRLAQDRASLRLDLQQVIELLPAVGARLGYGEHELLDAPLRMVLRGEAERAFFSMVGEQVRYQEAEVLLESERGRTLVRVSGALVHGPEGGPLRRRARGGDDWYDPFFDALELEVDKRILKASYAIPRE